MSSAPAQILATKPHGRRGIWAAIRSSRGAFTVTELHRRTGIDRAQIIRYLTGLGQAVRQGQATGGVDRAARRAPAIEAEEMTACARCGTYVSAAKPSACSRADCPYRR